MTRKSVISTMYSHSTMAIYNNLNSISYFQVWDYTTRKFQMCGIRVHIISSIIHLCVLLVGYPIMNTVLMPFKYKSYIAG